MMLKPICLPWRHSGCLKPMPNRDAAVRAGKLNGGGGGGLEGGKGLMSD